MRPTTSVIVACFVALTAACGSSSSPTEEVLRGEYVATNAGPIKTIDFEDAVHYSMLMTSCSDGKTSCTESGTYQLASDDSTVTFKSSSGKTTSYPFQALSTNAPAASSAPVTLALHVLGGISLTSGSNAPLGSGAGTALGSGAGTALGSGAGAALGSGAGAALGSGSNASLIAQVLEALIGAFQMGQQGFQGGGDAGAPGGSDGGSSVSSGGGGGGGSSSTSSSNAADAGAPDGSDAGDAGDAALADAGDAG